ncbi:MAG: hypothetical protein J5554_07875 [Paludibacteraceae bacterium]|nr:hypothetical protein [Paludibacteraceae bacterium]
MDVLSNLLSALGGALVGTFLGSYFLHWWQNGKMKSMRSIATKALDIFLSYAKTSKTYNDAESEFNNKLSVAEKRIIIVVLHKLGIPISLERGFNIKHICFPEIKIEVDEVKAMKEQVSSGYCDQLFHLDPDSYFNSNIRITSLRNLAKRWVKDVFFNSNSDKEKKNVTYPDKWFEKYTLGERYALEVFKVRVCSMEYFDSDGHPIKDKMGTLITDIDLGWWDSCLCWDYDSYRNVITANQLNSAICNTLSNVQTNQQQ